MHRGYFETPAKLVPRLQKLVMESFFAEYFLLCASNVYITLLVKLPRHRNLTTFLLNVSPRCLSLFLFFSPISLTAPLRGGRVIRHSIIEVITCSCQNGPRLNVISTNKKELNAPLSSNGDTTALCLMSLISTKLCEYRIAKEARCLLE